MPAKTIKIILRAKDIKVAIGHQPWARGCGTHKDPRTRRNRTRTNQNQQAIKEWA